MSFTSVYHFQNLNGCESVISKANSQMNFMGFRRILLEAGQELEYVVEGEEQGLVLQNGDFQATVIYKGETVLDGVSGVRHSVFEELPTALYAPPAATVKLSSTEGCEIRIFTAWMEEGEEGNAPCFVEPKDIEETEPGTYIYKRKYRKVFGQPGTHNDKITKKLIVGETVSIPGGWIGWPAHRHDYVTEKECVLDEIFSFQITSETGEGGLFQHGYDRKDDGTKIWDEVNVIETSDTAIGLPSGYHTTLAFPGSVVYLLWGLAGEGEKEYRVQFDERYSWLEGCLY